MRLFSLFFLLGTLSIQMRPKLPSLIWPMLLLSCAVIMVIWSSIRGKQIKNNHKFNRLVLNPLAIALLAFLGGVVLADISATHQLNAQLTSSLEGKDLIIDGVITDIPELRSNVEYQYKKQANVSQQNPMAQRRTPQNDAPQHSERQKHSLRFRIKINKAYTFSEHQPVSLSGVVRVGWYQEVKPVAAGERWQLHVRLKRPTGFMNPAGFDYEKWLFSQRIIASGYVRQDKSGNRSTQLNQRIAAPPWWSVNHLREMIHKNIQKQVQDKSSAAVLSALAVAERSKLDRRQWNLLQRTGTSHLVAISGLHIAIVAGFGFFPVLLLWRLFPMLNEFVPVRVAGGVAGIIIATAYAMLAGFTLPTQRALLMVIIGLIGLISRSNYPPSMIMAAALVAVLLLDPLAAMTASFWLSFIAVGLILIIAKRQLSLDRPRLHIVVLQILLSLGMVPLTLLFFGSVSVSAPLANLFAIPWVSLIVIPLVLLGLLFIPLLSVLSGVFFNLAALAINVLFGALEFLGDQPGLMVNVPQIPAVYLILAFVGFLFVLLPKGFPGRWLGVLPILPVLFFSPARPFMGDFSYTLLDAGQGMASVLQTANHTLIYDVGKRVNNHFDIGRLVVVPYLKAKGLNNIDLMMISHEDIDHRGGAQAVLDSVKVAAIQSSDTRILPDYSVTTCKQGEHWRWDGVNFEILSPPPAWLNKDSHINDNNRSCVLRVSNAYHSLLLTGDIQKKAEHFLVDNVADKIPSEVMIVPHHGSKTSSGPNFIETVNPEIALIPVGYRNRFGHPRQAVISRYERAGIQVLDTVHSGAIQLYFYQNRDIAEVHAWRTENRKFWNR